MRTVVLDAQMNRSDVTREMMSRDESGATLHAMGAARFPRVVVVVTGRRRRVVMDEMRIEAGRLSWISRVWKSFGSWSVFLRFDMFVDTFVR